MKRSCGFVVHLRRAFRERQREFLQRPKSKSMPKPTTSSAELEGPDQQKLVHEDFAASILAHATSFGSSTKHIVPANEVAIRPFYPAGLHREAKPPSFLELPPPLHQLPYAGCPAHCTGPKCNPGRSKAQLVIDRLPALPAKGKFNTTRSKIHPVPSTCLSARRLSQQRHHVHVQDTHRQPETVSVAILQACHESLHAPSRAAVD